jgi:hypothetical protein
MDQTEPAYIWGTVNHRSVKHAWVRMAGHFTTTCSQHTMLAGEVPLVTTGSEIICGACKMAIDWYTKTGQTDYLKPRPAIFTEQRDE